jgi:arylsulfatase A-like enzyme
MRSQLHRHIVKTLSTLSVAFILSTLNVVAAQSAPAVDSRPNILVLLTDDQRWDTMGCMGNRLIQTPQMDRLAAEGTLFTHAFVTSSICAASRASIFTGLYERTHRCNFNTGPLKASLLKQSYPMLLRNAGYTTGFIGKYGVGDVGEREMDGDAVFDHWDGFYGQGSYFPKDAGGRHLTQVMFDQACDFFERIDDDRPFCLSISFKAPHSGQGYLDLTPDPSLKDLYENVTLPKPVTARQELFEALPEFLQRSNARTSYWKLRYSTPDLFQEIMKDYYRLITGVDKVLGRLRDELAKRGLADNTVILFLSDNGEMTGDYLLGGKELLYDASIRIPMIDYDPRIPATERRHRRDPMVLNIDVAPTVLALAGEPVPKAMQGSNMIPLLRHGQVEWRDAFFCENNFRLHNQNYPMIEGIRTAKWKYVRYPEIDPVHEQLFELERDPHETKNLAADDDHSRTLSRLRRLCDRFMELPAR